MKKILALILAIATVACVFTSCGTPTMEKIYEDTNLAVASVGDQDIYAYEMIYLMKMGYPKEEALEEITNLKVTLIKAEEKGFTALDEDAQTIENQLSELATQFGGEEQLAKEFENLGITEEQYKNILQDSLIAERFTSKIVELGIFKEVTDEETLKFYNENFLRSQHILFATRDTATNAELSEEEAAKKQQAAQDTLNKIKAGASFDKFLDLSDDPGLESSPNGYTFVNTKTDAFKDEQLLTMFQQSGMPIMVEEFETTTANLKVGEISDIVKSEYGYHIIQRYELAADAEYESLKPYISSILNNSNYLKLVDSWKAEMKQKTNKYYEVLEVTPAGQEETPAQ